MARFCIICSKKWSFVFEQLAYIEVVYKKVQKCILIIKYNIWTFCEKGHPSACWNMTYNNVKRIAHAQRNNGLTPLFTPIWLHIKQVLLLHSQWSWQIADKCSFSFVVNLIFSSFDWSEELSRSRSDINPSDYCTAFCVSAGFVVPI